MEPRILLIYFHELSDYLESFEKKGSDHPVVPQLRLLLQFLRTEYSDDFEAAEALLEHGEITFDLLWTILVPNKEYYTADYRTGEPRCVKLKWATEHRGGNCRPFYSLDCEYLESFGRSSDHPSINKNSATPVNNRKFGRAKYIDVIAGFQGAVKINSLSIFPFEYHPRMEEVRNTLIARGKKWEGLDGVHHKNYSGIGYQMVLGKLKRVYVSKTSFFSSFFFFLATMAYHSVM